MIITLIGRPGRLVQRGTTIVMALESREVPSLPQGLPEWPADRVTYTVYLSHKQWRKVEAQFQNPRDVVIVRGHCFYDPEEKGIAVLAKSIQLKAHRPVAPGFRNIRS